MVVIIARSMRARQNGVSVGVMRQSRLRSSFGRTTTNERTMSRIWPTGPMSVVQTIGAATMSRNSLATEMLTREDIFHRVLVNTVKAGEIAGVTRRTIHNWIRLGKVEVVRTPSGHPRIYA